MPVTDDFVVQFLLDGTMSADQQIVWMDQEGWFWAQLGEVRVELRVALSAQGSRWVVRFIHAGQVAQVSEPARAFFSRHSNDAEDQRLSDLLKKLVQAVSQQCARRKLYAIDNEDEIRQRIYRHLLFAETLAKD